MEFTDDSEDVEQDNEVPEGSDQINVLEVSPPKESTAPIPLVNVSNSSDNSKEEAWFDEDMFFNETNPTKVNTTTSDDDDVYFDERSLQVQIIRTMVAPIHVMMTLIPIIILEMRCQTIQMMMDIMDMVNIMNMVNMIEVITGPRKLILDVIRR